jgi:hypothetical protein
MTERKPPWTPTFGGGLLRRLSIPVGLLTALAYVLVRSCSELFYAPLGLSPEEIGLDQAALLGRAIGVLLFSIGFGIANLPWIVPWLRRRQAGTSAKHPGWVFIVPLVVAILLGVLVNDVAGVFAFIFGYGYLVVALDVGQIDWRDPVVPRVAFALVTLVIVATAVVYGIVAVGDRQAVEDGRGISDSGRFLSPWDASVATVTWIGVKPAPSAIAALGCGLYLGSNDGTSYLFDPGEDETLRIPTSAVVIQTEDSDKVVCERGKLKPR